MNPLLNAGAQSGLVLASRSPRRRDILRALGFEFDIDPASEEAEARAEDRFTERAPDDPFGLAEAIARGKCAEVCERRPDSLVLAADTLVVLDGDVLPKPRNDTEAIDFLRALSGATHTVVTGVALGRSSGTVDESGSERTRVTFRRLGERELARYVATGEGRDKAGSYAAQGLGAGLIRSIDGCFYNVVGLPVALVFDMLGRG